MKFERVTSSPLNSDVIVLFVALTRPPARDTVEGRVVALNVSGMIPTWSKIVNELAPETLEDPLLIELFVSWISGPLFVLVRSAP